ncbi:MAG: hypothetical protein K2Y27_16330 [Xanthobacteraceae bacterium]|nr:hypothetical protein [Xanthobacteraceae bacterium]
MTMSRIEVLMAERMEERLAVASARTLATLDALENSGFKAWVVGSLAKQTFAIHSDVDFLVDCDRVSKHAAFRIVEDEMGDFPFHFVCAQELDEVTRRDMMGEAASASSIRAHTHTPG